MLPLHVLHVAGDIPGLPGLFMAGVFSGSLSTISSGLNSLAAISLQFMPAKTLKEMSAIKQVYHTLPMTKRLTDFSRTQYKSNQLYSFLLKEEISLMHNLFNFIKSD